MKKIIGTPLGICFMLVVFFYGTTNGNASESLNPIDEKYHSSLKTLRTAWEPWYPYDYLQIKTLQSSLTGLDIDLLKHFAKDANQHLVFQELLWDATLKALEQGEVDLAGGATYSDERARYVYFSKPYRFEEDSLFVLRSQAKKYDFENVDEFLDFIKKNNFRIGVKKGSLLADPKMNDFINNPDNAKYIVPAEDDSENLRMLLKREVDGFLADRIVGSTLVWQAGKEDAVVEHYLNMKTSIHLIFSKKSVAPETVQIFNNAINKIRDQTSYRNDFAWYVYPVIMLQTTGQTWFRALDVLGTIFFAISGVLIAYSLNQSILAAFVYAILPSLTGGILRDIIFNKRPIEALKTPEYLVLICSVILLGYLISYGLNKIMQYERIKMQSDTISRTISKYKKYLKQLLIVCDALGLATLSVSGVMISLMARAEPLWLWGPFFAFLTGAFGTILRDILSKKERLEEVVGEPYSEVAIVWGLFFSVALIFNANNIRPELVQNLIMVTVLGTFITRLIVYYFKVPNVYFR